MSDATAERRYEPVIGLEIHLQLSTRTKMFCGCALSFGDAPNTHTCPICLGHPGTLPVTNAEAVHYGLAAARQLVRAATLSDAYAAHPERFVHQPPTPPAIPTAAWINQPAAPPREEARDVTQKLGA